MLLSNAELLYANGGQSNPCSDYFIGFPQSGERGSWPPAKWTRTLSKQSLALCRSVQTSMLIKCCHGLQCWGRKALAKESPLLSYYHFIENDVYLPRLFRLLPTRLQVRCRAPSLKWSLLTEKLKKEKLMEWKWAYFVNIYKNQSLYLNLIKICIEYILSNW